ncbi:hypothetical protein C8J56DRAFT_883769 [Mycena floridula]|nr:hypothetical protein C8J56DRAFT_883769 [Mycena floridula]
MSVSPCPFTYLRARRRALGLAAGVCGDVMPVMPRWGTPLRWRLGCGGDVRESTNSMSSRNVVSACGTSGILYEKRKLDSKPEKAHLVGVDIFKDIVDRQFKERFNAAWWLLDLRVGVVNYTTHGSSHEL